MSDLHAINLHLQKCLERDWREQDLVALRVRIADATIRVAEAASAAGFNSSLAVVLTRICASRNLEPETE